MTLTNEIDRLVEELIRSLQHLARSGFSGFDCDPATLTVLESWSRPTQPQVQDRVAGHAPRRPERLPAIADALKDCQRCRLSRNRNCLVFGSGNPKAELMFVGEGPGYEEDKQGQPFVGAAGQLLTRIIAAMKLTREAVYICNVVKCRPPGNRNPEADEIRTCLPFLERQIQAVRPRVICALGNVAVRSLLGTQLPVSRLRGRFHDHHGIPVMPTYHPAYLLRNPAKKREVWEDVQKIMRILEEGA